MNIFSKLCLLSSGVLLLSLGACKKSYLDRTPSDVVPIEDAFKTTTGCKAALEGIHSLMYNTTDHDQFGQKSVDLVNDLMGDDMPVSGQGAGWFLSYLSYAGPRSGTGYIWSYYYRFVNNCNELLAHIDKAEGPEADKDNIKGQTYFYLAYAYYNLSLYYQHTYAADKNALGVPVYHEVTQQGNPRVTLENLYGEITADLDKAASYLSSSSTRANKSEVNIDVVNGLYARVALVMQNWPLAAEKAAEARANYPYMSAAQLMQGFNDWGNGAWIWGSYINEEQTGIYASFLSQMDVALGGYAAYGQQKLVNKALYNYMNRLTAKGSDIRFNWWYPSDQSPYKKYSQRKFTAKTAGSFSSDVCYMRAEEMGLIQAEALAQIGGASLSQAKDVLSELMVIRNPEYNIDSVIAKTQYVVSPGHTLTEQEKVLIEIWYERRIELWGEGFRYSDLQRCAGFPANSPGLYAAQSSLQYFNQTIYFQGLHRELSGGEQSLYGTAITYTDALDNRFLFRIPTSEIDYNPNMVQNP